VVLGEGEGEGLGDGDGLGEGDGDGEREGLGEGFGEGFGLDALALGDELEGEGDGGAGDSKAISRPKVTGRITLDAWDELRLAGEGDSTGISETGDGEAAWMAADGANEGGESAKSPSPFGECEYTQMKRPIARPAAPQNVRSRLLSSRIPNVSFTPPHTAMDEGRPPRSCLTRYEGSRTLGPAAKWTQGDSNPRPHGCQPCALPAELWARSRDVYPADAASDPSSQPTRGASLHSRSRS
jgi:hypothetical protein